MKKRTKLTIGWFYELLEWGVCPNRVWQDWGLLLD